VQSSTAEQWCRENGNIPYFETSATKNVSVDNAFVEMAKLALKRESSTNIFKLPDSIGGAGGAIKLTPSTEDPRGNPNGSKKSKKKGCC
jgi:hypothetical protein